jgi:hypothetical protein
MKPPRVSIGPPGVAADGLIQALRSLFPASEAARERVRQESIPRRREGGEITANTTRPFASGGPRVAAAKRRRRSASSSSGGSSDSDSDSSDSYSSSDGGETDESELMRVLYALHVRCEEKEMRSCAAVREHNSLVSLPVGSGVAARESLFMLTTSSTESESPVLRKKQGAEGSSNSSSSSSSEDDQGHGGVPSFFGGGYPGFGGQPRFAGRGKMAVSSSVVSRLESSVRPGEGRLPRLSVVVFRAVDCVRTVDSSSSPDGDTEMASEEAVLPTEVLLSLRLSATLQLGRMVVALDMDGTASEDCRGAYRQCCSLVEAEVQDAVHDASEAAPCFSPLVIPVSLGTGVGLGSETFDWWSALPESGATRVVVRTRGSFATPGRRARTREMKISSLRDALLRLVAAPVAIGSLASVPVVFAVSAAEAVGDKLLVVGFLAEGVLRVGQLLRSLQGLDGYGRKLLSVERISTHPRGSPEHEATPGFTLFLILSPTERPSIDDEDDWSPVAVECPLRGGDVLVAPSRAALPDTAAARTLYRPPLHHALAFEMRGVVIVGGSVAPGSVVDVSAHHTRVQAVTTLVARVATESLSGSQVTGPGEMFDVGDTLRLSVRPRQLLALRAAYGDGGTAPSSDLTYSGAGVDHCFVHLRTAGPASVSGGQAVVAGRVCSVLTRTTPWEPSVHQLLPRELRARVRLLFLLARCERSHEGVSWGDLSEDVLLTIVRDVVSHDLRQETVRGRDRGRDTAQVWKSRPLEY